MTETHAVDIRNVSKSFKTDFWKRRFQALQDVSFHVQEGAVFGLVGPNGAGKTTIIKILMGLIRASEGQATIFGTPCDTVEAKRILGYLPESSYYYDYLRGHEILDFYARLFGLPSRQRRQRIEELLELVGLTEARDRKLRFYSKGMLQRIGIAQALVNDPRLVILDEPMSGLDPMGRKEVRDIILKLKQQGKTILFSSHILSDIEQLSDQVAILVKGRLKAFGPLSELIRPRTKEVEVTFQGACEEWLPVHKCKSPPRIVAGHTVLSIEDTTDLLDELLEYGHSKGLRLLSVVPHRESLEDLFVEVSRKMA